MQTMAFQNGKNTRISVDGNLIGAVTKLTVDSEYGYSGEYLGGEDAYPNGEQRHTVSIFSACPLPLGTASRPVVAIECTGARISFFHCAYLRCEQSVAADSAYLYRYVLRSVRQEVEVYD